MNLPFSKSLQGYPTCDTRQGGDLAGFLAVKHIDLTVKVCRQQQKAIGIFENFLTHCEWPLTFSNC